MAATEADATTDEAGRLRRFIGGLDPAPRVMTDPEIAKEINDPFGRLLVEAASAPATVSDVLDLIGPPDDPSGPLLDQTVYLTHDAGQIPLAAAPDLIRRPRAVVLRRDDRARDAVFVAPSMRDGGTLEVMGWDTTKALFNYYERRHGDGGAAVWLWRGDTSHAWSETTRGHGCFACHLNGEVVMKELRLPWQNWDSQNSSIKPESLPPDSPLKTDPLFSLSDNRFLRSGEQLELALKQWIAATNATKVRRYQSGALGTAALLEPFFRTTTVNLVSSQEQSESVGNEPIGLPVSFFIDQRGLFDVGELFCDSMLSLSQNLAVPRSEYRRALRDLGFRLTQPGTFEKRPGDTFFAFFASEVPRVDFDLIAQAVRAGLVSRRTAVDLMLVDLPNPVYSTIRAALYERVRAASPADEQVAVDELVDEVFRAAAEDASLDAATRREASSFLSRQSTLDDAWEAAGCAVVDDYLGAVVQRFERGEYQPYFELLASRYEALRASDHAALIESHILLPQTNPYSNLTMRADGSVGQAP